MSKEIFISDFYCTKCGRKTYPLARKVSRQHEPGHLKNMWCPYCEEERNCVEIRPFGQYTLEEFKIEYSMGNFDETGKRKESYKQCIARYYKER